MPYEEWRLGGDPLAEECDPRDYEDPEACVVTLIECRDIAKPIVVTYLEKIDIYDDQVNEILARSFLLGHLHRGLARRRRHLETDERLADGRPVVLRSRDRRALPGLHRFALPQDQRQLHPERLGEQVLQERQPALLDQPLRRPGSPKSRWTIRYRGERVRHLLPRQPGQGHRGLRTRLPLRRRLLRHRHLGRARPAAVGQLRRGRRRRRARHRRDPLQLPVGGAGSDRHPEGARRRDVRLVERPVDDPGTTPDGDETERRSSLGDIVWYKPERITSGRRDAYIPVVGSARGAGFAIAWQEDPEGLRPGKGKGPGEGWSGAITNHKTDIWYTFITYDDFAIVDENFVPGGPRRRRRPTATRATSTSRVSDGPRPWCPSPAGADLRQRHGQHPHPQGRAELDLRRRPTAPDGTETGLLPRGGGRHLRAHRPRGDRQAEFCDHPTPTRRPAATPTTTRATPTARTSRASTATSPGPSATPTWPRRWTRSTTRPVSTWPAATACLDYQYYIDSGGTLDLCDTAGDQLATWKRCQAPARHERWFGFVNSAGAVEAGLRQLRRPPARRRRLRVAAHAPAPAVHEAGHGTKSAWALLAYEESKGMGHSLAASRARGRDRRDPRRRAPTTRARTSRSSRTSART